MKQYTQDWIGKWAVYSPDKVALAEQGSDRRMTYGQLNRLGNRLANYFQDELALVKGDRIAVVADNCLEYIVLFSAAQKAGLTLVPLNYRFTGKEIDYLLSNADPKLVIGEDKYQPLLDAAPMYKKIAHHWSLDDLQAFCDPAEEKPGDAHFELVPVDENDPIFILFTAGTTGFPKGALYTHKMLFWNSINTAMSLIINTESRTVNCMPPFHTGGWNVLTTPLLHHGGFIFLMKKFEPAEVLRLINEEKVSIFMGVPTMLKMMADEPAFESSDFSQLYYIIVGGEPMPIPLIEKWHKKGVPIRQGYGMTEVGPNLTSLHQDDAVRKKGSIGRPNYYVEIKIVDEKGREMPANQAGELLLKGPMVTPGYWKNEEATRKTIEEGWFHTGDRVRQDEEGYLFVVDRIKNMFISGGENVYPAEVERALVAHPEVSEVAVIGVPDDRWGEVGHAFVVSVKGAKLSAETLKEYCLEHLAKFKIPKHYSFLEALPKNDAGKINKRILKEKS
jgi:fatty-acyl-CoA synthase